MKRLAWLYGDEGCFNTIDENNNPAMKSSKVKKLLETMPIHEMWVKFGQETYPYDENFMAVSEYIFEGKAKKLGGIKDGKWEPKKSS